MEALETINKVFAFNLRKLRGSRTQSDIAEGAGLSLRNYQALEGGTIPRTRTIITGLAKTLGVQETALFLDPDLITSRKPTPHEALDILREAIMKTI